MQDRFLADVGDFGKFGLLRHLADANADPVSTLAVIWYTVLSHNNRSPSRYRYLENANLIACDPPLARALRQIAFQGTLSDVPFVPILPVATAYFGDPVPVAGNTRVDWCARAVRMAHGYDIVFLDPDNGIAESNSSIHHVREAELALFAQLDATIVVYHHLHRREPHHLQLVALRRRVCRILPKRTVHLLWYRRGGSRVFLVASPLSADAAIGQRLRTFVERPWAEHFIYLAHSDGDSSRGHSKPPRRIPRKRLQ